jgi:hypothetical protein
MSLVTVLVITLCLKSTALAQQPLLPNLTPLPAFDISAGLNSDGDPELRFAFLSWNSGVGPFELIAGELAQGRQNVYQRIYNDNDTYADTLAGNFEWHQGHNHFHFEDYALYVLPAIIGNSQRTSQKTSFCLLDTNLIDGSLPGSPSQAVYTSCGNLFQGISVGRGDKYGSNLSGQAISLSNLSDGDYRLETTVDPENRILETDETDNESCVLLHIVVSTPTPTFTVLNANSCVTGPDDDNDGVGNSIDNCTQVPNGPTIRDAGGNSQLDSNGDGYGNMCDPDFNGNGIVDPSDFSLLKSRFGQPGFADQDLNGNGIVDPSDFSLLKTMFGQPPGPSCCPVP